MVETFEWGWIESTGNINSLSEASEQDVVRVRESMQKAQQLGSQIRDDQKKNAHLAQFLTYLIGAVQSDEIRTVTVELFSKPDQTGVSTTLALYEMIALFLPFYATKAHELWIDNSFPSLNYEIQLARESYIGYIKMLYRMYPLYESLDKDTLSSLAVSLLLYHNVIALWEGQTHAAIAQTLRHAL